MSPFLIGFSNRANLKCALKGLDMRSIAPFGLRMPEQLKRALMHQAKTNKRSLNAEIILMLEQSLKASTAKDQ